MHINHCENDAAVNECVKIARDDGLGGNGGGGDGKGMCESGTKS